MEDETPELIINKFRHDINCLYDNVREKVIILFESLYFNLHLMLE